MKSRNKIQNSTSSSVTSWIFFGLVSTTLYFQTNLADPFNSPKSWILFFSASILLGHIVKSKKAIFDIKTLKIIFYLLMSFDIFFILATVFTDNKYFAIFGETQRRNGLLSYFSLAIFMLAASIYGDFNNVKILFYVTFVVGIILTGYALLQTSGNDFVNWVNPYNSIIGTLGNPNFAAAVMAIIGLIIFTFIFISDFKIQYRIAASVLSFFILFAIYRSNSKQGLVAYAIGAGVFLILTLTKRNKKIGVFFSLVYLLILLISILGMLQVGPMAKFLYKPSVSIRGYYWRAGLEMLRQHPFFGVGIDRYGAYFKEYREVNYSLNYGFEITSTNAHNTFIQFFATGGIFLGLTYLMLNGYIFSCAFSGLRKKSGSQFLYLASIFSAWIAFHAQSLISIDNVGISIWGWVFGGYLVALSKNDKLQNIFVNQFARNIKSYRNPTYSILSGFCAIFAISLIGILYHGESITYIATQPYNQQNTVSLANYRNIQLQVVNSRLIDDNYRLRSAINLAQVGNIEEALTITQKIYSKDPRNLDALNSLAILSENTKNYSGAIKYREILAKLDPWNAINYLELGRLYKNQGNLKKTQENLNRILSFAADKPVSQQAKLELAPKT